MRRCFRYFLYILLGIQLSCSAFAQSQDYTLSSYAIQREKLPDLYPHEVFVDDNGFMWLWSSTGLYYHNGRHFAPYKGMKWKYPSGGAHLAFFSDVNGFTWIIQHNLVSRHNDFPWSNLNIKIIDILNKKEFSFEEYFKEENIPDESCIKGISEGINNELWISFNTGEVYVFRVGAILEKVIDASANLNLSYVLPASDTTYWALVDNSLSEIDRCGNVLEKEIMPLPLISMKKGPQKNSVIITIGDYEFFQSFYKRHGHPYSTNIPSFQYDIPVNTTILVGENDEVIAIERGSVKWLRRNRKNDIFSLRNLFENQIWNAKSQLDKKGRLWSIDNSDIVCIWRSREVFDRIDKEVRIVNTRGIVPLNDSTLWINSSQGIYIVEKENIRRLPFKNARFGAGLGNFYAQDNNLWMAGFFPGIVKIKWPDLTYDMLDVLIRDSLRFRPPAGRTFKLDTKNRLWLTTQRGLALYNKEKGRFQITENCFFEKADVFHIHESDKGLWLATSDGIKLYLPEQDSIIDKNSFPSEYVTFIHENEVNQFWIGTKGQGLYCWDRSTEKLKQYTKEHGLGNMVVHAIYEDSKKCLWLPTNNGLYRFDPATEIFQSFYVEDGLCGNEFNMYSHFQREDGYLYLGGMEGIIGFYPDQWEPLPLRDELFHLESVRYIFSDGSEAIDTTFQVNQRTFQLKQLHKGIKLCFAWLDRWDGNLKKYYYRFIDDANDWMEIPDGILELVNLPPGIYSIEVKARSTNGVETSSNINIDIQVPIPWYMNSIFWVGAVFLLSLGIYLMVYARTCHLQKEKQKLEKEIARRTLDIEKEKQLTKEQNKRLETLNQIKNKLFAIIGHELRGPIGYFQNAGKNLNYLLKKGEFERAISLSKQLESTSLMAYSILDNLLKIGLAETDRLPLYLESVDLEEMLAEDLMAYAPLAHQKGVELSGFASDLESYIAYADKNSIRLIMNNLLGNSIKFTPANGEINIELFKKNDTVGFTVKDTGIGISKEQIDKIFQLNFSTPGTEGEKGLGMGLYLCKQLVKLNNGSIHVNSAKGQGTDIKVILPALD